MSYWQQRDNGGLENAAMFSVVTAFISLWLWRWEPPSEWAFILTINARTFFGCIFAIEAPMSMMLLSELWRRR